MLFKNTQTQYGVVSIFLHWLIALLMIGLVIVGLYMVELPIGLLKLKLYGLHKEFGFLVLMLAMWRIVWRITNALPSLSTLPRWERFAARTVHWAFYGFMFALPISGWLVTSAAGLPVSFFKLFVIPTIIPANQDQLHLYQEIHEWLGYGLILTFFGHAAAALKHHFINKDDVLIRMLK